MTAEKSMADKIAETQKRAREQMNLMGGRPDPSADKVASRLDAEARSEEAK